MKPSTYYKLPVIVIPTCMLVAQSCPTLSDPMDCSPPGSSVHGISQARVLEWVAIPFSRISSWPRDRTQVSHIADRFFTIWVTREAPYMHKLSLLLKLHQKIQLITLLFSCWVMQSWNGWSTDTNCASRVPGWGPELVHNQVCLFTTSQSEWVKWGMHVVVRGLFLGSSIFYSKIHPISFFCY